MKRCGVCLAAVVILSFVGASANAAIQFDQNVTPEVIFGSGGNDNGFFVVDQVTDTQIGMEVGLRAKLRHDENGWPQNIFNSDGQGTYTFAPGVAPTQSFPTGVWSFEWSINSNFNGNGKVLNQYEYLLGIDSDPGVGQVSWSVFDPINLDYADHAIGTNATLNCAGIEAADAAEYNALISQNNVAQNSWKAHWFVSGFDPTVEGEYSFFLAAFDPGTAFDSPKFNPQEDSLAYTEMNVVVSNQTAVPEPASMIVWGLLGTTGIGAAIRRRRRNAA